MDRKTTQLGSKARIAFVAVAASGALGFAILNACTNDTPQGHVNPVLAGGACAGDGGLAPGAFPSGSCDNSSEMCPTTLAMGCPIDTTKCGSPMTCEPLTNNTGKAQYDFRFRRLTVVAPPTLTVSTIQDQIITGGISLNTKACGEYGTAGPALFNWLFQIDTTTKSIVTGGGPPATDPFGAGFCFYNQNVSGLIVDAVSVPYTATPNGDMTTTYATMTPIPVLNIPIFTSYAPPMVPVPIVLPLHNVVLKDIVVSADDNCIGSFNEYALQNDCTDSTKTCPKWKTDGALGAYITLEDADKVPVLQLNESLCVLLSAGASKVAGANGGIAVCARDSAGKITGFQGNYCSTTLMANDCADSVWLAATFAASAATINDGSGNPLCPAQTPPPVDAGIDSGTDSGSPTDASGDDGSTDSGTDSNAPSDAGTDAAG